MQKVLCPQNHYYNPSLNARCPFCFPAGGIDATAPVSDFGVPVGGVGPPPIGVIMPVDPVAGIGKTEPVVQRGFGQDVNIGETLPVSRPFPGSHTEAGWKPATDDEVTRPLMKEEIGFDPVVGWLVCVDGADKGRDLRLHSENNYIGRSEKMDIVIRNDNTISRENHAIISYDPIEKAYYFAQGAGRGIVRINGKAVLTMAELHAYDLIQIGMTKLVFVPLCGEGFDWLE